MARYSTYFQLVDPLSSVGRSIMTLPRMKKPEERGKGLCVTRSRNSATLSQKIRHLLIAIGLTHRHMKCRHLPCHQEIS